MRTNIWKDEDEYFDPKFKKIFDLNIETGFKVYALTVNSIYYGVYLSTQVYFLVHVRIGPLTA